MGSAIVAHSTEKRNGLRRRKNAFGGGEKKLTIGPSLKKKGVVSANNVIQSVVRDHRMMNQRDVQVGSDRG